MANIVIIGGGVTGLSAGIHLLEAGEHHRVTICEAHARPGGNLTGWERQGHQIDNCIHWLNGTHPSTPLYREWVRLGALGDGVEIRKRDSLYTCRIGQDELTLWRDQARVEREMRWYAPRDEREISRLFRAVRGLQGISGLDTGEGRRVTDMVDLLRYAHMTTGEMADRFSHPLIRQFLTAVCGREFAAVAQLEIMAQFCGGNADLPAGGSAAMAERIADTFRSLGGILRLSTRVERVEYEHRREGYDRHARAVCARQREHTLHIPADLVILTCDPAVACPQLLGVPLPPELAWRYADAATAGHGRRFSAVQAAISCPRKRVGFQGDLILPRPQGFPFGAEGTSLLLRAFSHEPQFAPPDKTVIQIMVFCDEREARRILSLPTAAYRRFKQEFAALCAPIAEMVCPRVRGAGEIHLLDVWTPATYRRFTGSEVGSFMGFTMMPKDILRDGLLGLGEKLKLRPAHGRIPGLDNILSAGQWLRSPGGLPIAAEEGARVAEVAMRLLREHGRIRVEPVGAWQG